MKHAPVMKGVYLRSSSYRGRAVETAELVHVDTGVFGFTDRNLYFAGPSKSHAVRGWTWGLQGCGVSEASGVITQNGWFVYNAVVQLASR
jgi:hypothetical protein